MTQAETGMGAREAPMLGVVAGATMLVLLIFTAPLTTLGPTALALEAGPSAQAWFLSAMPLGAASGLLAAGALGDARGRRAVFLLGLAVMAAGSALGAMAPAAPVLILARVTQGLGGAGVLACGLGLLGHAFPEGRARTFAAAAWAAGLGAGVAVGPIFAALATRFGGWSAAYWGTAILAAVILAAGRAVLPEPGDIRRRRVDWPGAVLLMAGLAMVMAGLTEMRLGWARPSWALLLGTGAALLAGFLRLQAGRRDPLLDPRLFRSAGFLGATVAAFASGAGVLALMTLVPTVLSRAMNASALAAALTLCAWSATSAVAALCARWLPEGLGPRGLLAGGLLGCAAAQFSLLGLSPAAGLARVLPALFLAGAANGVLNAALGRQAVATVPPDRAAMGGGANNTARYLGSAIGITLGAALIAQGAETGGTQGLLAGWDAAVLATGGASVLGALVVALARD